MQTSTGAGLYNAPALLLWICCYGFVFLELSFSLMWWRFEWLNRSNNCTFENF